MPPNTPQQLTIDDMFAADEAEANDQTLGVELTSAHQQAATSWLSPTQAAARTPLSRKAIYGAIRRHELRASKRCARRMIRETDLEAWITSGVPDEPQDLPARPRLRPSRPAAGSLAALRAIEATTASPPSDTFAATTLRSAR